MSEQWRVKTYYEPRVLIETADVLSSPFPDALLCLTGAELGLLRNLMQYLHRRATFVSEYRDTTYLAPTTEQWDQLQAIVADLEDKIMSCEDLTEQLDEIVEQLKCICRKSCATQAGVQHWIDDGALQYPDNYGGTTIPVDAERCAAAQLTWAWSWEILTEVIQPAQDKAMDVLLPLALAALASWIGTPLLGIPVGVLTACLSGVIEIWTDGSLESVANALFAAKEDLVCEVYNGLETSAQSAYERAAAVIDVLPGWSPIDKIVGKLLYSPWVMDRMLVAHNNATEWAVANTVSGYCDVCLEPVIGSNWWAMPLSAEGNTLVLYKPPNSWDYDRQCWNHEVVAGQEAVGYVVQMTVRDSQHWSRMSNWDGCQEGGTGFSPNTSETWNQAAPHTYFYAKSGEIDAVECKAQLAPGSTSMPSFYKCVGPQTARQGVQAGSQYAPACNITLVWTWAIYKGTSPP